MSGLLRVVLLTDAVLLVLLGILLLLTPAAMLQWFGYREVPGSVNFIVSTWGAVMLATGYSYWRASREPALSDTWVQFGLLRNLLEATVAAKFVLDGTVELRQSWPGVFIPVWFALFYALFMLLTRNPGFMARLREATSGR